MAKLTFENNEMLEDLTLIREVLLPLNIELAHWPIEKTPQIGALLNSATLQPEQKEELLKCLDSRFEEQKEKYGYQTRDLVALHPDVSKLDDLLNQFNRCHKHSDDEVRYIVDGSGIFGFVLPDLSQVCLEVEAGEYIRVPALTEHWFVLTPKRRIKAVRYFTSQAGWVANYTGTPIRFPI